MVAFFNQLSGINAILGFAPRIFGMTGVSESAELFNASLVTLVNLVFTLIGLRLIDKLGRRTLLYIGSFGYIASLGCGTHWIFAALLTLLFPIAVSAFSATTLFGFFAVMMFLHLLWVHFLVPETKGVSLEDMEERLKGR